MLPTTSTNNLTSALSGTNAANKNNSTTQTTSANSFAKSIDSQALSQTDFLRLLTTQVKNQDPTKPMDSTQFVSQLAQFSALAGVSELNTTMQGVANNIQSSQLVQGASLVGHKVLAPGNVGELTNETPLVGSVNLPTTTDSLALKIFDSAGSLVQTINLGSRAAGAIPFSWDGAGANGQKALPGNYKVEANYLENNKMVGADTMIAARVNSVALAANRLMLQIQNLGEMGIDEVSMLM